MSRNIAVTSFLLLSILSARAEQVARFGEGEGPVVDEGVYRLLRGAERESNAIAFGRKKAGAFERMELTCWLRVLKGGDGGAFCFLSTAEYGARGPAPFVKEWTAPNLRGSFAVGIDVHNPKNEEMFGPWGNYRGMPEREVSLHWDGREIVKRVAPVEFRGDWTDCRIVVEHVVGGAEVTVALAGAKVYDRYFIAALRPYEARLAIGAGTRADATTEFDVMELGFEQTTPAKPRRAPRRFPLFNHVLTDNSKTFYETEVDLPPRSWAFGRVILTLQIHDAGPDWDEWDRNGELSVYDDEGNKRGIVPFITSYRTECFWRVDVTHFRPWLHGKRKFEIRAGTTFYKNRGYMMSASLAYYPGEPELEPHRIVPAWNGTAQYRSDENHFRDFFSPVTFTPDEATKAVRLWTTTTGHSQVGEFTPSKRTVVLAAGGEKHRFANTLWRDDVYLNPNRPQFGTWKFSRAGWAPGDVVRPWWIDLTEHVEPGEPAELRYEPAPYEFAGDRVPDPKEVAKARHVVRSYVILSREPDGLVRAPSLLVTGVARGSNAREAGLRRGDYLAEYDGKRLDSIADLRAALAAAQEAGKEQIPIVAFRGAKRLELTLPPGRMGVNLSEG